eukprot:TRINITY_DN1318_c0_g1_i1.p1 TRINITY_DN1318_c0_g1~~TRINITY_DN1318_c0_g1_i1.p1  ORF type:complete len:305 (-),score=62.33 TRINITY_DN1318_c0_g1_i1:147-1061(-)
MGDPNEESESLEHLPRAKDGIYAAAARSLTQAAGLYYRNPMRVFRPHAMEPLSLIKHRDLTPKASKSTVKAVRTVLKEDGLRGLLKLVAPPLVMNTAVGTVVFATYNAVLDAMALHHDHLKFHQIFLAGVTAGASSFILSGPADVAKDQLRSHPDRSFQNIIKDVYKHKGIAGFYEGGTAVVMRDTISLALFFSTYELTKRDLKHHLPQSYGSDVISVLCAGGLAGVAHKVSCYPFDLIKATMMVQEGQVSYQKALNDLVKQIGWKGIFKGWARSVSWRVMPSSAIGLLVYELTIHREDHSGHL